MHLYLKNHFRENAKYGSKDRKQISRLCYAYFRTGNALRDIPVKEKILASLFLCADEPDQLFTALKPEWSGEIENNLDEKLEFLRLSGLELTIRQLFPLFDHLSGLLDSPPRFVLSHLVQPRLFLRVRPGREDAVESGLRKAGIPYNIFDHTVEVANSTDLADVLTIDRDVIIQDLSSQRTGNYIRKAIDTIGKGARVWDCCAASGGKAMMAYDLDPTIELTVSDIRPSILENLSARFRRAGINKYHSFVSDLSSQPRTGFYDIIIADVPCSGSGTWGRTPEEMFFFSSSKLDRYTDAQLKIVKNVSRNLRPGGILLYFTCSVYKDENEAMCNLISGETDLISESMELTGGWESGADSMFMAMFRKPARS